ncbi:MAG: UTP--glucose-1-phosphate uridylyltransferase, partial [Bacteroidetes bacterium]|nr:UTP--glucose-1-phosphate uridylyltransferase [Bacteroidota bacterium]
MSKLIECIVSNDLEIRNQSLEAFSSAATIDELLNECKYLEEFRMTSNNLYEQVRALFFLYAIHRFYLPMKKGFPKGGTIPFDAYEDILYRRFEEAIQKFLAAQKRNGPSDGLSSALAEAYRNLGFQTLANQVKVSVRSVRGNQWMFRIGHPSDHPLRIKQVLIQKKNKLYPILHEQTPVRMDLSHSGWSDIFFLGMDFPEGARVLNISIDLSVRGGEKAQTPRPPVEVFFRVIEEPMIRLVSTDLGAVSEITTFRQLFDFAADYLGLLKAAVIAAGIVPSSMEGTNQPIADLLEQLVGPGLGIEIVSQVNGIPKGSRLAVSTTLLASIITVCMRATGQIASLTGSLSEAERRTVAARAILGEWLGGSGGGWQDSGGVWPGIKLIEGVKSQEGDTEFGVSRGCLLPRHTILDYNEVSEKTRTKLQNSLILVHGGMAQDVGPILEMVTERYLLRLEREWKGRLKALELFDEILGELKKGNISQLGKLTHENFFGPIQTIIPWASNIYTEAIIEKVKAEFGNKFWGFWMLGGMSGGGMGFLFDPSRKSEAQSRLEEIMKELKKRFEKGIPFAIEPVVYDFSINEKGTWSEILTNTNALMPKRYYALMIPSIIRQDPHTITQEQRNELEHFTFICKTNPAYEGMFQQIIDRILPVSSVQNTQDCSLAELLQQLGFDRIQHEQIKTDLRNGRIG